MPTPRKKKVPKIDKAILEQLEGELHPEAKQEITVDVKNLDVKLLNSFLQGLFPDDPYQRIATMLTWFAWISIGVSEPVYAQMMDYLVKCRRGFQDTRRELDAQSRQEIQGQED